jgi:hypothetical protein
MVKNKFRPVLVVIFVVLFFIQGCAGRAARPVKVTQSGDVKKSCEVLKIEMRKYRRNIQKRIPPIKAADKKRTLLMLSGGLLIVPWFFLDLSDADKIEANAVRARHNYLADRAKKLKCRFKISYLKAFYFHDKGYKKNRNR